MRPRKFNYFGMFSEDMQSLALFSVSNVMTTRGVLCSAQIFIALNRFTALYRPFQQERIWKASTVTASIMIVWVLFIVTSLPVIIIYHDTPHFFFTKSGILQMSGGMIDEYNSYQGVIISIFTVITCSICYVYSFWKARITTRTINATQLIEYRILLCAIASSFPFCFEMIRSILVLLSFRSKNDLYIWVTELWFFEMEIIATASVWLQLIINKSMRQHLFRNLVYKQWRTEVSDGQWIQLRPQIT
ncbi:unnamed protein product [Cylicocyclus nassatus]|uniref:Uncharacterized protein n=1 Tax=Cylicocyclus nassatus TaxID=53992 RepID=A0AA36GP24_CYLNA|nr:unnamed protein product [Cylicocyclus nassatus]